MRICKLRRVMACVLSYIADKAGVSIVVGMKIRIPNGVDSDIVFLREYGYARSCEFFRSKDEMKKGKNYKPRRRIIDGFKINTRMGAYGYYPGDEVMTTFYRDPAMVVGLDETDGTLLCFSWSEFQQEGFPLWCFLSGKYKIKKLLKRHGMKLIKNGEMAQK